MIYTFGKLVGRFITDILITVFLLLIVCLVSRVAMLLLLSGNSQLYDLNDLLSVLSMGARFDAKIGTIVGILIAIPRLFTNLPIVVINWSRLIWGLALSVLAANFYYFSFYQTPFNALMFGLLDDDTTAIVQTMWHDFPIIRIVLCVIALAFCITFLQGKITVAILNHTSFVHSRPLVFIPCLLASLTLVVFMMKGTLHGVALQRQHMIVTNNMFLNDIVPNGVSALYYAYSAKKNEPEMDDVEYMVRKLGFENVFDAARALGIDVKNTSSLLDALYTKKTSLQVDKRPKDLIFFLMESMGAEPFLYQSKDFGVLGKLADVKSDSCHFSNFDALQSGTFPRLEGILYHTPITPLTQGKYAYKTMPWSIAATLQSAGYHTVFFTGGRSSWRNLDQSLLNQGFNEIVDAGSLLEAYPDIEMDMWGIPDEYLFEKIQEYRDNYNGNKPLFIFALTITNHPPYTLPSHSQKIELDISHWKGDSKDPLLKANLLTYRYSANELGKFVANNQSDINQDNLIIAAKGDHNARTFGLYSGSGERQYANQVPFLLWAHGLDCGSQLSSPASHRDMFPSIFPLLNANVEYLATGRNLLAASSEQYAIEQIQTAAQFTGFIRDANVGWNIFDPELSSTSDRFECFNSNPSQCELNPRHIDVEKARFALAVCIYVINYHIQ